ncbi:hypothetical protein NDU88_003126 [Pleurodeles waltl]|uniref:Uncharacterized protein n=1 Tax=Pleurodeles waltl TaxID=8319 RepID=A0AAV7T4F3_PLEWA|nr:hypothetical protein NDU88_003126 [Pleurodeles waltl]
MHSCESLVGVMICRAQRTCQGEAGRFQALTELGSSAQARRSAAGDGTLWAELRTERTQVLQIPRTAPSLEHSGNAALNEVVFLIRQMMLADGFRPVASCAAVLQQFAMNGKGEREVLKRPNRCTR